MQPFNTALLNKATSCVACCVLSVSLGGSLFAQDPKPASPSASVETQTQAASPVSSSEFASAELPDSPGAAWTQAQDPTTQQNTSPQTATPPSTPAVSPETATQDQTQKPQRPVGTAAAAAPKVNGVTAAQPSGVAIAPAKQRRVRTIVLKVGAMIGAGVAVGTVIALTAGTPSKPPGAH
jgi:hypothetical protein